VGITRTNRNGFRSRGGSTRFRSSDRSAPSPARRGEVPGAGGSPA